MTLRLRLFPPAEEPVGAYRQGTYHEEVANEVREDSTFPPLKEHRCNFGNDAYSGCRQRKADRSSKAVTEVLTLAPPEGNAQGGEHEKKIPPQATHAVEQLPWNRSQVLPPSSPKGEDENKDNAYNRRQLDAEKHVVASSRRIFFKNHNTSRFLKRNTQAGQSCSNCAQPFSKNRERKVLSGKPCFPCSSTF